MNALVKKRNAAKAALEFIEPGIRLPLAWLAPEHEGRVLDAMAAAGLDVSPTGVV